jgi:hypothetical protein
MEGLLSVLTGDAECADIGCTKAKKRMVSSRGIDSMINLPAMSKGDSYGEQMD